MKKKIVSDWCALSYDHLTLFNAAIALLFSGEEGYGRYLDLYNNHTTYTNLKGMGKRPSYLQYLDLLIAVQNGPLHADLSNETRFSKDYET